MKTFTRFSLTVLIILFLAGCSTGEPKTYNVNFYLGGLLIETIEVQEGFRIPATNKIVADRVAEQGLYWAQIEKHESPEVVANAQVLEDYLKYVEGYFWSVDNPGGTNDGLVWDFNEPVLGDMVLSAENTEKPYKFMIAGRKKEFYDNAFRNINNTTNTGVYVMLLGEDAGEPDNEILQLFGREVNNVTLFQGLNIGIAGIGKERTIYTKGSGAFVLPGDAIYGATSLLLGNNITIKGRLGENGTGMIRVGDGKGQTLPHGRMQQITFTMLEGSKVTGYTGRNDFGAGDAGGSAISVHGSHRNNVLFHMKGGTITGNGNVWEEGKIGSGVTLNNARMIMEGNAVIKGNTGFGGDLAFGMSPGNTNYYLELKDNATIGEMYLFNNNISTPNNNIRISDGWTGSIQKLNLGWGGTGTFTGINNWRSTAIIRNSVAGGSIADFLENINLGDTFQWNNGNVNLDALNAYRINPANGMLADKQ